MALDAFGNTVDDGSTGAVNPDGSVIVDANTKFPATPADPSQATPASVAAATTTTPTKAFGFDDQSFLTTDQQALSRTIQKGFDQSLAQRDRDLARYNAPALSSNIEDEALARAMAFARASNSGAGGVPGSTRPVAAGRGGGGGGGSAGRALGSAGVPGGARTAGALSPRANAVSGWASLIPWILGSNTISDIQKQGLLRYFLGNKGVTPGQQTNSPLEGDWRAGDTAPVQGSDPNGDYVSNALGSVDPNFYGDPSGGDLTDLFSGGDTSGGDVQTFPYDSSGGLDSSVPDFGFSSGGNPDDFSWLTDVFGGGSP